MSDPRINPQDSQPAQRPKRKRGPPSAPGGASTSFFSPNQFAVLSNGESDKDMNKEPEPLPPNNRTIRIPPIVIYSYLNNHSATLKQVNEKLITSADVKSKANRLLLYTKSTQDYNTLLAEIQSAKLAYQTYPLPEAIHTRLVLKGVSPNIPEEDVRDELVAQDIQVVRVSQLTKMDKNTPAITTRYPIFLITFQPGTDIRKVLQLHKLCHCIIQWEKYKSSQPIRQCFNCQSFGHSSTYCGKPSKCVKCDQQHASKDCTKPAGSTPTCVNCGGDHPANFTGCPQYLQQLTHTQRTSFQQRQPRSSATTQSTLKYQQSQFPALRTPQPSPRQQQTWAHAATRTSDVTNHQPFSSVLESIKSILAMFDLPKLCIQLRSLASAIQEPGDPITKLVVVIDTVVSCLSPSK